MIELVEIRKSYGGWQALRGVSLRLERGAVHALVGENGAGKSTVAKILAGALRPDAGEIRIGGTRVELSSTRVARRYGIALVSQELTLVPKRPVIENVLAGALPTWAPTLLSRRRMRQRFREIQDAAGVDLPADEPVERLGLVDQQFVEILRAMNGELRILILDEPTAAMTRDQADTVLALTRRLAESGVAVVFISHALEDVLEVSDEISVLRDGALVRTAAAGESSRESLIEAMIGRPLDEQYPVRRPAPADAPIVLRARGIRIGTLVQGVDLDVRAGEILGVAGLIGSGRSELIRCLAGADRRDGGNIELAGHRVRMRDVREAKRAGVVMVPEDRKLLGLHLDHSIERNVTLPHLAKISRAGLIRPRASRAAADQAVARLGIAARSSRASVRSLSGGNQQRTLFAKWLVDDPLVVLADEPTRGVDVAGKRAIYDLLVDLARRGAGVVVVSSELPEVIGLSHRVLVMHRGRCAAELRGAGITEEAIVHAAFGEPAAA